AGARRPAVKIAFFRGAADVFAPRCAGDTSVARRERLEDRIAMFEGLLRPTNHHAIASLQAPHAAAGADIDIVDLPFAKCLCSARVVFEIRVAAVDDDVAFVEARGEFIDSGFGCVTRRYHDPNCAWLVQLRDEIVERVRSSCAFASKLLHIVGAEVEDDAIMSTAHQATHHVRAHPTQTNHSKLHLTSSLVELCASVDLSASVVELRCEAFTTE